MPRSVKPVPEEVPASDPEPMHPASAPLSPKDELTVALDQAAEAPAEPFTEYKTVNGVTLTVRAVPSFAMRAAALRVPRPAPPMVYIESKDREEPNPNDPEYTYALERWEQAQIEAVNDVILALGTKYVSVPEDVPSPQDDTWIDVLQELGFEIPGSPTQRYIAWLKYIVLSERDLALLMINIVRLSGVSEVDVARQVMAFRRNAQRRADPSGTPAE